MTVYVDDMFRYPIGKFRRMKMSHLIADTSDELLAMVDTIGVARKWIQKPGTPLEHFDIAMVKRELAVKAGAIEITYRQYGVMVGQRIGVGTLGTPADAQEWIDEQRAQGGQRAP